MRDRACPTSGSDGSFVPIVNPRASPSGREPRSRQSVPRTKNASGRAANAACSSSALLAVRVATHAGCCVCSSFAQNPKGSGGTITSASFQLEVRQLERFRETKARIHQISPPCLYWL
eukprot:scaffold137608_cov127-Phaeocystis_antarctica.AAC.1